MFQFIKNLFTTRKQPTFSIEWHIERLRKRHEFEVKQLRRLALSNQYARRQIDKLHQEMMSGN